MSRPNAIVAHVIFVDLVRSSALSLEAFGQATRALRRLVLDTEEYRTQAARGRAQTEDTGDGLSIAFLEDPSSPVECLAEFWNALETQPELTIRVGIHSGPLVESDGLRGKVYTGAAFAGAKRVMESAKPGQALLSVASAEILSHFDRWKGQIGPPKSARGKNGQSFRVHEFVPCRPAAKTEASGAGSTAARKPRWPSYAILGVALLGIGAATGTFRGRSAGVGTGMERALTGRKVSWDLARDYFTSNRPGCPWTIGGRVDGAFLRETSMVKDRMQGLHWHNSWRNDNNETAFGIHRGHVSLNSNLATPDARWTAPYSGTFSVHAILGGPATGDRFGRGNYNAEKGGMLINEVPVRYTTFDQNRMYFDIEGVRLSVGQTVDLYVRRAEYGGDTDTQFTITSADGPP